MKKFLLLTAVAALSLTALGQNKQKGGYGYLYCLFAIVLLILEWILRDREYSNPAALLHNRAFRWTLYLALILLIITFTGKSQAFIYFQF